MSKTKRKRYTGAFKAKVGLEALMGVKTVGQIARDYQVHPVQVTQWKGILRDHLPELFESPRTASEDNHCAGGDFLVWAHQPDAYRGSRAIRTDYRAQGPCRTDVRYLKETTGNDYWQTDYAPSTKGWSPTFSLPRNDLRALDIEFEPVATSTTKPSKTT
jgi:hypothetical protein